MSDLELVTKVSKLPSNLKEQVSDYVDFLISKHGIPKAEKKPLKFGMMKGMIKMSDDFDEPLDEFKDYM